MTVTPASSVLLNFSYRGSDREDRSNRFAANQAATTGSGNEAQQQIGIAEGSWIVNASSLLTFKYTHFAYETTGTPDIISDATFSDAIGTRLDVANLDRMGNLTVPAPITGQTAYNAFIQPDDRPLRLQSSTAFPPAAASTASPRSWTQNDFFRDAGQIAYNVMFGSTVAHELHVGVSAVHRLGGLDPQLERLGRHQRSRRPPELQRHADLLHGALSGAGPGPSRARFTPNTSRRASRSTTRSAGTT